jgi:hypothetical protein
LRTSVWGPLGRKLKEGETRHMPYPGVHQTEKNDIRFGI